MSAAQDKRDANGIRLAEVASLVVLAGAFFYTALRVAYGVFYDRLNATPEDVGLGYQQILAQSVGALVILLLAAGLGIVAAWWLARWLRRRLGDVAAFRNEAVKKTPRAPTTPKDRAVGWLILAGGTAVIVAVAVLADSELAVVLGVVGFAVLVAAVTAYERYTQLKDERAARYVRVGYLATFIAVAFVAALVLLCLKAKSDAEAVKAGDTGAFELLGIPVTSWGATPARLEPAADAPPSLPGGCVRYLGQADGVVLVFEPGDGAGRTSRFPVAQVVVSLGDC